MIEKETIFGANDLSPNFLVIEDSEEELDHQTSFTSDMFLYKNSSAPFATHKEDSSHSKTSSPSLNRPSDSIKSLFEHNTQSTSSIASRESLSVPNDQVLNRLDVTNLLEYQPAGNLLETSPLPSSTNILRGGHIDALIFLATSANTTVIAGLKSNNSSRSFIRL